MSHTAPTLESVATINEDGSRRFIHPSFAPGRYGSARALAGVVLLLIYFGLPFLKIGGNPAVFLDIAKRQFHLFGFTFVTQDLWLAFFAVTGLGFSLFYITAILGRIWCGWACPQTVFLDIARRVERWIEGDGPDRRALDQLPWTLGKTFKRGLKQLFFLGFAFILAHVFLSYFVSVQELYKWVHQAPGQHWAAFLLVAAITAALWFNLAWFREQFCIVLCPYGRLQSALIDNDTIVIGYDTKRGEPRGKKGTAGAGDCVDCRKCVQVCPTGIDIRQGLQLECIACSACVDACDSIMEKLKRPRGLIRYDSLNGFAGKPKRFIRPRMILYTLLLCLGITAASLAVSTLRPANLSITRITGAPYFLEEGQVRNQFILRVFSKKNQQETFHISLVDPPRGLLLSTGGDSLSVTALGEGMQTVVLTMPRADFTHEFAVKIRVANDNSDVILERSVPFLGPQIL